MIYNIVIKYRIWYVSYLKYINHNNLFGIYSYNLLNISNFTIHFCHLCATPNFKSWIRPWDILFRSYKDVSKCLILFPRATLKTCEQLYPSLNFVLKRIQWPQSSLYYWVIWQTTCQACIITWLYNGHNQAWSIRILRSGQSSACTFTEVIMCTSFFLLFLFYLHYLLCVLHLHEWGN